MKISATILFYIIISTSFTTMSFVKAFTATAPRVARCAPQARRFTRITRNAALSCSSVSSPTTTFSSHFQNKPPFPTISKTGLRAASSSTTTSTPVPIPISCADFFSLPVPKVDDPPTTQTYALSGWIRSQRGQKTLTFIALSDGSHPALPQIVIDRTLLPEGDADALIDGDTTTVSDLTTGSSITAICRLATPAREGNPPDLVPLSITLHGASDPATYPLAKKQHSLEYLRKISHLRGRSNTISSVARVRNFVAFEIHNYYQNIGCIEVASPIITLGDCEGGGEAFRVTAFNLDESATIPKVKKSATTTDYGADFFGAPTFLSVSGQLSLEASASCYSKAYTFGPTFRAEQSTGGRHLAEFRMVEAEYSFVEDGLTTIMDDVERLVRHLATALRDPDMKRKTSLGLVEDLKFFEKHYDKELSSKLKTLAEKPFARIEYGDAIDLLKTEISKNRKKWQFPDLKWGDDMNSEHERWLAEVYAGGPIFVCNYPESIKAFYMRLNEEEGGDGDNKRSTVACFDLLVPKVGELAGGSMREERLDVLTRKMVGKGMDVSKDSPYWWYLDLRRYGTTKHGGYGVGFERLVAWICGVESVREVVPFARVWGHAEF
jgi:asparaginyl-tRNA synthetase